MARKFYIEDNGEGAIKFDLSQPSGYTEITDRNQLEDLHAVKYNSRRNDGIEYMNKLTASLYIDILNGTHTEIEVTNMEEHIHILYEEITRGHWISAKNTNSNLSLSGIYDQQMKDKIQSDLNDYVTNNY